MAGKQIVLVTGANGYVAGQTIAALLSAGYAVRGTVRSKSSAKALVDAFSNYGDALEIVEVPDIVAPGAFDEAVKGVHAIAHLAAPVGFHFTDPEPILEAAVQGTTVILQSAIKESSIKSVVLMSSVAAIASDKPKPYTFTEKDWNLDALPAVEKLGKNAPGRLIYVASKVAGEQAFWKFRDEKKPTFAMTAVNPVFIMGPPAALGSIDQLSATTEFIWTVFSGKDIPAPLTPAPAYVDVRDVARVVVFGIQNPDVANNERYLLHRDVVFPQTAAEILRKNFPDSRDRIKAGESVLVGEGESTIDGSKAVRVTGQDYYAVEQTIVDTAKALEKFL